MSGTVPPALRVARLEAPFGEAPGLEGLSLEVARGERLVIVGASGAGKTTLLRAIAGLTPVRGGEIRVGGRDVTARPPEARGTVYLHQAPVLFPHLDVFENVAFPLRVRGIAASAVRERVGSLLGRMRLADFERRAPATLSGGQRHRVALARAIAASPAVLLLDEPLAALDPGLRDDLRDAIVDVQAAEDLAMIIVTHDLDEAGIVADRIGILLDRRLAQLDAPAELFRHPASAEIARFVGFVNRIECGVREDGSLETPLGAIPPHPSRRWVRPGPAVALFRPESGRVAADGFRARVESVRYRPGGPTVVVRAERARFEIALREAEPPRPGQAVHIAIDAAAVVVFPRD